MDISFLLAHGGPIQRTPLPIDEVVFAWGAAAVLVVSFAALALLWPKPKLEKTSWRPLPLGARGRCSAAARWRSPAARSASRCSASCSWRATSAPARGSTTSPSTFVMITFWVGLVVVSILFGDVFRAFNPWRAIGRATGALVGRRAPARRALPRAARPLAGGRGAGDVHLDRAGRRVGRHGVAADDGRRRLHRGHARRPGRLGRRDLDAARRGVLGLLQPVLAHQRVRDARPRRRPAPAAGRAAATGPGARHRRVRDRDDRHRHLRRAQPGRPVGRRSSRGCRTCSRRSAWRSTARSTWPTRSA